MIKKAAKSQKNILLGVTASIAAYKACDIISALKKEGFSVIACMTKDAQVFITPLTLQTLTGNKVFTDMFQAENNYNPMHIKLAQWADLFLIAPATADTISKIAAGICDDILTCTAVSTDAPVWFAPAMNDKMYGNAIIQENMNKLKKHNCSFIGPKEGSLACGYEGMGHIADVEDIVEQVKRAL